MDFTVNMMDTSRGPHLPGNLVSYHNNQNGHHQSNHSLGNGQQQAAVVTAVHHQQHPRPDNTPNMKENCNDTFTPPPRVASGNSHQENRVEKSTETMEFEPPIKMEIRGQIPGAIMPEKDKNEVYQLQFNTVGEVLRYFQPCGTIDPFNLMTNSDLIRNHFLCVPNASQEPNRASTNGFVHNQGQATVSQPVASPNVVNTAPTMVGGKPIKQEGRPDLPNTAAIIHRNVQLLPQPNQYVCWICDLDLLKSLPYEEHMTETHRIEKPYKCDQCEIYFKRKAHLDRHRRIHLPTRPYQCGICGKGFTRNEHVRRHAFTHSGERPWKCGTCSKSFFRQEHLKKHSASHARASGESSIAASNHAHSAGEYELMYSPAESPSESLQMPTLLTNEVSMQIGSGLLPISQFSNQSTLNQLGINMNKQQSQSDDEGIGSGVLVQTTDVNGRIVAIAHPSSNSVPNSGSLVNQSVYQMGMPSTSQGQSTRQNSSEAGRPYQCGVCGKAFIRNEHLRRHVLTHSGQKPYSCNECSKAFSRKEHLTKHQKGHAKSSNHPSNTNVTQALQVSNGHPALMSQSGSSQISVSSGLLNNAQNQPVAAHTGSVTHPIPSSHHPSVTHYLPMFSLLAEVV